MSFAGIADDAARAALSAPIATAAAHLDIARPMVTRLAAASGAYEEAATRVAAAELAPVVEALTGADTALSNANAGRRLQMVIGPGVNFISEARSKIIEGARTAQSGFLPNVQRLTEARRLLAEALGKLG